MRAKNKGYIKNYNTGDLREFVINPSSFSDSIGINFNEIGGGGVNKKYQYSGRENRDIDLEIYIRSTSVSEINNFKNFLENFIPPTDNRFIPPPVMIFCIGSYIKRCIMTNLRREWTEFNEELEVNEIFLRLTLKEVE